MAIRVVIPARMASTRLPNKVLADIAGKPMVQHVYEQAIKSRADSVVIATDHAEVKQAAEAFGAEVCMTREDHPSGTSRIAEVVEQQNYVDNDIVINVQGDEPLLPFELIDQVAQLSQATPEAAVATLSEPMNNVTDVLGSHDVKVVTDKDGFALYFSRAPIPFDVKRFPKSLDDHFVYQRHVGLYAYSAAFLKNYTELEASPLEKLESLEQLRVLWHGKKIIVGSAVKSSGVAVDTPEDLEKVRKLCDL
jgi:3-deoxy-manno-octulosonate cytidylyltransferase (CMP-KDO synthetase)